MARWVTDRVAVGGIAVSPANWKELVEETEISAVINLRSEHQDSFVPPMPTAYLWLPVDDHSDPTPEQLWLGAQFIDTAVRNGQTVLVHCKMGIGRSPTLAAAYLVLTGLSVDEAIRRIEGSPGSPYGPAVSRATLNDFAASLRTSKRAN
jgi:hypothetical protein